MKIALIGYGKMGKEIERIALSRGHAICCIIDANDNDKFTSPEFAEADVAIEFSTPQSALNNYLKAFAAGVKVVSGTTGWLADMPTIEKACNEQGCTFFYASNFSLGVNIFFALNKKLAEMMNAFADYSVRMEEIHHIHKLDAPSGTAITLAQDIDARLNRTSGWALAEDATPSELPITAIRRDEVPGTHTIYYTSDADTIAIQHEAHNRKGFALGAVLAAEYTHQHTGLLSMNDMLQY